MENLSLREIGKINPELEKNLRDEVFAKARDAEENYHCAECGMTDKSRIWFQVDHIIPMNAGGKTTLDNLQILCRKCNGRKGDK